MTEFLEDYNRVMLNSRIGDEMRLSLLPDYCDYSTRRLVKYLREFKERDWVGL